MLERTKEITEFWLSGSLRICIYGACLKRLLPELSFSDRWSRGTKLWERDWALDICRTDTTKINFEEILRQWDRRCWVTVVSKSSTVTFRDGFARISADGRPKHRNKLSSLSLFVKLFWCLLSTDLVHTDIKRISECWCCFAAGQIFITNIMKKHFKS